MEEHYNLYIHTQFTNIWNEGILFSLNASPNVIDNIIVVSAQMAITDPNYYGQTGLIDIVIRLKNDPAILQHEVIIRLSKLIREMLSYPALREVVRDFLDTLMTTQNFDLVLDIVLGVTRRLRYTLEFDPLYWIKRLLDQAAKDSYDKTSRALLDLAIQSGLRIYEFLEHLISWLPDDERQVSNYPRSSLDVLRLIMAYCSYTLLKMGDDEFGAWPSNYPLFATLQNDEESGEKLQIIISALFHPALGYTLTKDLNEIAPPELVNLGLAIDAELLGADFIDAWFFVLCGQDKNAVNPEALIIARLLLRQLYNTLNKKQRRKLMKHWKYKINMYRANNSKNHLENSMKPVIRSLSKLRKEFRIIGKDDY
ncbi:MAG: hypothetical protein GY941_29330 [Planctomycetes bacterium]|nr:hypothetical protein [Planctomycetota bacterium]